MYIIYYLSINFIGTLFVIRPDLKLILKVIDFLIYVIYILFLLQVVIPRGFYKTSDICKYVEGFYCMNFTIPPFQIYAQDTYLYSIGI